MYVYYYHYNIFDQYRIVDLEDDDDSDDYVDADVGD
jgi:hypothetical protein